MATEATVLEAQTRRMLEAQVRDAQRIRQLSPAIDPGLIGASQSAVQPDIDASQRGRAFGTPQEQAQNQPRNLQRVAALRQAALAHSTASAEAAAAALANRVYANGVRFFQSELSANILALEVIVSPALFLIIFTLRCFSVLLPLKAKGVYIVPPYRLTTLAGLGEFIPHLAFAVGILFIYLAIVTFISFVAWFVTASLWTKVKVISDVGSGALKALCQTVTNSSCSVFGGGASGGAGATGGF